TLNVSSAPAWSTGRKPYSSTEPNWMLLMPVIKCPVGEPAGRSDDGAVACGWICPTPVPANGAITKPVRAKPALSTEKSPRNAIRTGASAVRPAASGCHRTPIPTPIRRVTCTRAVIDTNPVGPTPEAGTGHDSGGSHIAGPIGLSGGGSASAYAA